jgi:hypothetical protein
LAESRSREPIHADKSKITRSLRMGLIWINLLAIWHSITNKLWLPGSSCSAQSNMTGNRARMVCQTKWRESMDLILIIIVLLLLFGGGFGYSRWGYGGGIGIGGILLIVLVLYLLLGRGRF